MELARPVRLAGLESATLAADGGSPSELRRRVARLLGEPLSEPLRISRGGLFAGLGVAAIVLAASGSFQTRATADDKPVAKEERSESKDDVEAVKSIGKVLKQAAESKQQMLKLPVRIVDPDGKPVAKAKVFPWACEVRKGMDGGRRMTKSLALGRKKS